MAKVHTIPTELQQKVIEANQWLFYGDKKKVAKLANKNEKYTIEVIQAVMRGDGRKFNREIIECAIEVMNENKARFQISQLKVA